MFVHILLPSFSHTLTSQGVLGKGVGEKHWEKVLCSNGYHCATEFEREIAGVIVIVLVQVQDLVAVWCFLARKLLAIRLQLPRVYDMQVVLV